MIWLGRVTPSDWLDVIDRKACFLSLLAQVAVWLLELRVSQHFSTFYEPSVQAMDAQLNAVNTSRPRSNRFWLLELRVSRTFLGSVSH
jgi:hypothetical protein